MDWQIGDIIREKITLKFHKEDDDPIINTFLILDIIAADCYLIHSIEHSITYKLMPLDDSVVYEKVG